jgi:hypothetical protein
MRQTPPSGLSYAQLLHFAQREWELIADGRFDELAELDTERGDFGCHKASSPAAGAATTLRQPAGPSRGASRTEAPDSRARSVAALISGTST